MSYRTEPAFNPDNEPTPDDESRFQCGCGCGLWLVDGDPDNVRVYNAGKPWSGECASNHPVIARERELASRADVARDDDMNERRR